MGFNLAAAFRAFVAGLHAGVDPAAVEALAGHLEHLEATVAQHAEQLTGDAAHFVEGYTGPAAPEVSTGDTGEKSPGPTFSDAQPPA